MRIGVKSMDEFCDNAIIGAGPYGLSIAAHLNEQRVDFRIFGKAMEAWDTKMPKGMLLKSDGHATSLYDPGHKFSFKKYCADHDIPYDDFAIPPRLESFIEYGRAFQKSLVPNLEEKTVTTLENQDGGYVLTLVDGTICRAKSVTVASGISHFAAMPKVLTGFAREIVTHSADHSDLSVFGGRRVAVIGAGSSAADIAGLLHRAGAEVHLICRDMISFSSRALQSRSLYDRLRHPSTVIGPGLKSFLYCNFPLGFYRLPQETRLKIVRCHLGPMPAAFSKDMVVGRVAMHLGLEPVGGEPNSGGIELALANNGGDRSKLQVDHVICATGYKAGLSRLPFIDDKLRSRIDAVEDTPILTPYFESSLTGLYFVGLLSANSFGPLVRFACGAAFAAPRLARHLGKKRT